MKQLKYISSQGVECELDGPVSYVGPALDLRSRSWSRTLGYRNLSSVSRPAREVDIELNTTAAELDRLRRVFDADVSNNTPGVLISGGFRQRALIVEQMPKDTFNLGGYITAALTVVLLDGAWWAIKSESFVPQTGDTDYPWLDFEFDFEFDFGRPPYDSKVDTGLMDAAPIYMIIYGPAVNPYVIIGGNRYELQTTVPAGAHAVIDGKNATINLVTATGQKVDIFSAGSRGTGQGGGRYIFEPVKAGTQTVSWDNSFGFDLGWYDMEGEPLWNRS